MHRHWFALHYPKLLLAFFVFVSVAGTCRNTSTGAAGAKKNTLAAGCYKGRLEIKGLCMNYVIKVLDGDTSALQLERSWTDETTNKVYTNAFALGSRCTFPEMAEGAEFYFTLAPTADAGCNVCMAYRPVPPTKNNIVVRQTPCN